MQALQYFTDQVRKKAIGHIANVTAVWESFKSAEHNKIE